MSALSRTIDVLPGLAAAMAVAGLALGAEWIERAVLGGAPFDALVLAIIAGTLIQTLVGLDARLAAGVRFGTKTVLEVAIVLLGATISAGAVVSAGPALLLTVMVVVAVALTASYRVARWLGLDARLAVLVACGNSICGNSAIMAAAPVVEAPGRDVAASIAFTAALGVLVVVLLPLLAAPLGLSQWQYGVVAGLSVYAVPQVLAASAPVGAMAVQVGTLVKLMRVLMLGPVVLLLGLAHGRRVQVAPASLVPWFILGFLAAMLARTVGLVPEVALPGLHLGSNALTLVSMAALGLTVDLRSVLASGGRVLLAGALSILMLLGLALGAAMLLGG